MISTIAGAFRIAEIRNKVLFTAGILALYRLVQSAVEHKDLGTATAGATFFRSMGGSFGTAVFGAMFANVLAGHLARHLVGVRLPAGVTGASIGPQALAALPASAHAAFVTAYATSLQTVFLIAVPIAVVAVLLAMLLPEIELRSSTGASAPETSARPVDRISRRRGHSRLGGSLAPAVPAARAPEARRGQPRFSRSPIARRGKPAYVRSPT